MIKPLGLLTAKPIIYATDRLLGLRTYFTTGEKETRAWTFRAGMTAPQTAGVIHTDFERGFIRASTIGWEKLLEVGSLTNQDCPDTELIPKPVIQSSCLIQATTASGFFCCFA